MINESYFETHAKPKIRKINKKKRHTNPNDPKDNGSYREHYGL